MSIRHITACTLFVAVLAGALAPTFAQASDFDDGKARFSISIDGVEIEYRVFAWFAMPGTRLKLTSAAPIGVEASGIGIRDKVGAVEVIAPEAAGNYRVTIRSADDLIVLNLFVMRPATAIVDGKMGAYRIGRYPKTLFKGLPAYASPKGFIEVHREQRNIAVSPHFQLGQFLSKQASGWPKYLLLRPTLIIKLERTLENLNKLGVRADTFTVMSGYRTPWYNRAIGNRTTSSRHLYGGAADIFVDVDPHDGVMDDLDGDGRISKADADWLFDRLEGFSAKPWYRRHQGGLGAYGSTPAHGPFVHVDARGYRARWGR